MERYSDGTLCNRGTGGATNLDIARISRQPPLLLKISVSLKYALCWSNSASCFKPWRRFLLAGQFLPLRTQRFTETTAAKRTHTCMRYPDLPSVALSLANARYITSGGSNIHPSPSRPSKGSMQPLSKSTLPKGSDTAAVPEAAEDGEPEVEGAQAASLTTALPTAAAEELLEGNGGVGQVETGTPAAGISPSVPLLDTEKSHQGEEFLVAEGLSKAGIPPEAEGSDEGSGDAERNTASDSPPPAGGPNAYGRGRPLSAPFVQHYSKHMAIIWEWYTKTIGATMKGKRKQDEDALIVHAPSHWRRNIRFKAVFDGHGGSAVSRTCVAQFCNFFGNMPDLSAVTFKKTSLLFDEVIKADPVRHERGGSTGLVVAIERPCEKVPKFNIHTSNIGDSRAFILHKNGTYTIMSKDHKPSDPGEVARINRAGGFVSYIRRVFRVDGMLSLSRAFGDIRMKANPRLPATEQKVVAVPDVRKFAAFEGDYIFMACDGMFEAPGMTWDYVANLLQRELESTKDNLVETAFRMLNTAYLLGSADNISIVLTKLMSRKRNSSTVRRFSYDFSGKREFADTQELSSPNVYRSGTYHTSFGPVVTLF
ncbi:probable protein phosphatase 2C 56 [Cyclospora cayetanensis]|uniref:protein-serine/threonine phosphatase n=1 Tax=Cyclospora cayetanensis TaxID=88456 RepID=A0A6P6RR65_9EIME|nr:probable protein phosphatase 2C 56 [Cyclospora cayetanensis]